MNWHVLALKKKKPTSSNPCSGHVYHAHTSLASQAPSRSPAPSQLTSLCVLMLTLCNPHLVLHLNELGIISRTARPRMNHKSTSPHLALPLLKHGVTDTSTSHRSQSKAGFLAHLPSFSTSTDVSNIICSTAPSSGADWMW